LAETRRKFDSDFREGAVRPVRETGKPIAQVARDPGINEGARPLVAVRIGVTVTQSRPSALLLAAYQSRSRRAPPSR
jgi:Transposase